MPPIAKALLSAVALAVLSVVEELIRRRNSDRYDDNDHWDR